jgi:hypothetical protein
MRFSINRSMAVAVQKSSRQLLALRARSFQSLSSHRLRRNITVL